MSDLLNPNYLNQPQQIEKNTKDIKELQKSLDLIQYDTENEFLDVNGMRVYDNGDVQVQRDLQVKDELTIENRDKIVDENGDKVLNTTIDIGSRQFSFGGTVLPAIDVEVAREIYNKYNSGKPVTLLWELYGTFNRLNVLSSDIIAGRYSIDVLVHNEFHIAYSWDSETTGDVDVEVKGGVPSNPNLLINGDFRVNQRGLNSYNGTAVYTVDRWESRETSLTVEPLDEYGIKLTKSSVRTSTTTLSQAIENYKYLLGKTVTLSVKYKNNNISDGFEIGLYNSNTNNVASQALTSQTQITSESGIYSETITLPNSLTRNLLQFIIRIQNNASVNDSVEIEWVKLEIGSFATPFSPRPYAEELALCQRYYQIIENKTQMFGFTTSTTNARMSYILPVIMRSSPTTTVTSNVLIYLNGSVITPTNVSLYEIHNNCIIFHYTIPTSTEYMSVNGRNDRQITLDAEIY